MDDAFSAVGPFRYQFQFSLIEILQAPKVRFQRFITISGQIILALALADPQPHILIKYGGYPDQIRSRTASTSTNGEVGFDQDVQGLDWNVE